MGRVNKPPSAQKIKRAVEMRIGGSTWELVAGRLGCSTETVRKWPLRYADRWQAAWHEAECRLAERSRSDSTRALRTLLNDPNSHVRFRAARALLYEQIDRLKLRLRALVHAWPGTDEKRDNAVTPDFQNTAIPHQNAAPPTSPN